MTSVTGDIRFGETNGAGRVLVGRLAGPYWLPLALFILAILAGGFGWTPLFGRYVPDDLQWLQLPVSLAWIGGCWIAYVRLSRWRLRRGWERRGVVSPYRTTFALEDEAFVVTSDVSQMRVLWAGVTELAPTKRLWIFVINGLGYCLPRRLFGDVEAERAFIAAALARMEDSARGRSPEAMRFTEWEGKR